MDYQVLEEIRKTVTEIRDAQREMRTQLLGAAEGAETENGRLPKLEATVDEHETRIDALEDKDTHRKGWINGAAAVGAVVGSVVSALIAYIVHAFELVKK